MWNDNFSVLTLALELGETILCKISQSSDDLYYRKNIPVEVLWPQHFSDAYIRNYQLIFPSWNDLLLFHIESQILRLQRAEQTIKECQEKIELYKRELAVGYSFNPTI